MGARRRLEKLEAARGAEKTPYEIPMPTRLYLKALARHQARGVGGRLLAYSADELAAL